MVGVAVGLGVVQVEALGQMLVGMGLDGEGLAARQHLEEEGELATQQALEGLAVAQVGGSLDGGRGRGGIEREEGGHIWGVSHGGGDGYGSRKRKAPAPNDPKMKKKRMTPPASALCTPAPPASPWGACRSIARRRGRRDRPRR